MTSTIDAYLSECYAESGGFGPEREANLATHYPTAAEALYEIEHSGRILQVSPWIFRTWTGPRFVDGKPYDGPVYILGSREEYKP